MNAPDTIAAISSGPRIIRLLQGGGVSVVEVEPLQFFAVTRWSDCSRQRVGRRRA